MSYTSAKRKRGLIDWSIREKEFHDYLPKSLLRVGTFIIYSSIAMLVFIGWLLEYNDTVKATVTIITKALPIDILAESSGELVLLVKDNQAVQSGNHLALIKNTANFEDIQFLQELLSKSESTIAKAQTVTDNLDHLNIGELQGDLVSINKHYEQFNIYQKTDEHQILIQSKTEEIAFYNERITLFQQKSSLIEKDISIADKKLEVDKELYDKDVISERTLDQSTQSQISKAYTSLDNATFINDLQIEIKKQEQEIITIRSQSRGDSEQLKQNVSNALEILESNLNTWERKYLIKAHIDGICSFKEYLNNYQYINKSEKIFTIIPKNSTDYFGLLKLPTKGAGKVKLGQVVNVRLENYPADEFGILKGKIEEIAPIPSEGTFNVKVSFPDGLVSTYDVNFDFQQLMAGQAEIITNRMSFLDRVLNQVKARQLNQ